MMKTLRTLSVLACLLAPMAIFAASTPAPTSTAPAIKIAVVDLQKVLEQAPQMNTANSVLKKQFEPQEQQILAAQKKLKADSDKLQASAANATTQLQQQVTSDKSQLEQQFMTFRQNLIAAHNKSMQAVIAQVNATIASIAAQGQYNIVMQKQGVLYSDKSYDITDQVIATLKKQKN